MSRREGPPECGVPHFHTAQPVENRWPLLRRWPAQRTRNRRAVTRTRGTLFVLSRVLLCGK